MQNKPLRALLVGAVALATFGSAFAADYIRNNTTNLPIRWQSPTFSYRIFLGTDRTLIDGSNYSTSVQAAMQSWNELLGATQFQSTITSGTPSDGNRINEIAFGSNVFGRAFEGNTVAVTTTWSRGNERTEGDIIFNSGRTWDSYRGNTRSGVVDIRRVALHELGHALGLDHPDQAGQVVTAIMNSTTSNLDALSADDTTGGQNLYGPPGAPPNNNFANATLLTGTAISVTGYNTLATKETGEPNHADNTGGHSVWWRWTAPASGTVSLNTRNSFYDTTLAVYTGNTVNALTPIASDDDIVDGVVQASELTFTAIAGTTYRIAIDGFDGDVAAYALNLSLNGASPNAPLITAQPQNQAVTTGNSATFSVTATTDSGTLTYQWYLNGNPLTGATSSSYTIANAQVGNAGQYAVVVSNAAGSTTSNTATLTVTGSSAPAPSPGGGGGGGGGAPSHWFMLALALLGLGRRWQLARVRVRVRQ